MEAEPEALRRAACRLGGNVHEAVNYNRGCPLAAQVDVLLDARLEPQADSLDLAPTHDLCRGAGRRE
jgi:hypothetical protein